MNAAGLPLKPRKPRKTAGTDPVQYAARLVAYESECVVVEAALEKRKLSKEADKNLYNELDPQQAHLVTIRARHFHSQLQRFVASAFGAFGNARRFC